MKFHHLVLLGAVALGAAGCTHDAGPFTAPAVPLAYVRWVNAVPDTGALDFRFVDQVENTPYFGQFTFRQLSNYQGAAAGSRHIRVFPGGSTDINVVTQVMLDTTITFDAGKYYTLLQTGYARAGQTPRQHIVVIEDTRPTPSSTQIAVRAINAWPAQAVDVYAATDTASTNSGTPTFAALAFENAANYVTMSTGTLVFRVTATGDATTATQLKAPAGHDAASVSQTAQAGYSIGGSMLTAFVFPASVAGSKAASFTTPGVVWMQDNRPQ